jgi:hypothetical protein
MREATRRQILSDLGIPRWQLRAAAVAAGVPAPSRTAVPPAVADPVERPLPTAATSAGSALTAPAAPEPRWSVLSIAAAGVVLLVDGASSRRDLRLALDVVAAASGDWQVKPVSRRFDWRPELAGDGSLPSQAGQRALHAFVDKDLVDHGARLLLCVEPLGARLPDAWPGCRRMMIPALEVLGREAEAKRTLWLDLEEPAA